MLGAFIHFHNGTVIVGVSLITLLGGNIEMQKLIPVFIILFLTSNYVSATSLKFDILKKGTLNNTIFVENTAIKNSDELNKMRKEMNDMSFGSGVNFEHDILLVITAMNRNAVDLKIDEIEKRSEDTIEVIYSVTELEKMKLAQLGISKFPYLAAKVSKINNDHNKVIFMENLKNSPIASNTALDEDYRYSNILNTYQNLEILDYIPLDIGNKWTYRIDNGSKSYETSQEVQSVSNGWSILNSYFGKPNIAIKIDQSGQLIISSKKGGLRTFYNKSVIKSFISEEFETPAGKFNDLMIVTVPENSKFWFKDIYAKDVGLIYHEHKSAKGNGEYILIGANVRGKTYPN